jgi:hypothetical protein
MDILAILVLLLILLLVSTWSSAKSYFVKGRLAGMEEATLEIIRGIASHYEAAGQAPPDHVAKALEAVKIFARGASYEKRHLSIPGPALDLRRRRRVRLLAQGI